MLSLVIPAYAGIHVFELFCRVDASFRWHDSISLSVLRNFSYLDQISTYIRWLENPDIAKLVYDAILFYNTTEYEVIAFCIMPNHVHLVADMKHKNIPLNNILKRIKTFTALRSNSILNRSGKFWQNENYDHVVRDGNELRRIITYVLQNPVTAGLSKKWEDWKWAYVNMKYLE